MRSVGTDITLDDVLAILDEHYNNVKALDTLNQELFQLQMGERDSIGLGDTSVYASPSSCCIIPRLLSTRLRL